MTLFLHELKRGRLSLLIWSSAIAFMLGICILIYPEMSSQMTEVSDVFADMGSFSAAFGMDQVSFGEFKGYFAIECGNTFGLGGAFFAAILGISMLAKEEKDNTSEFLLTHPISRTRVITEKLFAMTVQIVILNVIVIAVSMLATLIIGESVSVKTFALLFLAYFLLQLEIAFVTFGISSFVKNVGLGIGLGMAILFYFVNIVSNLTDELEFLKYFTPFGFADGASIVADNALNGKYVFVGMIFTAVGILSAFFKYTKKDIS